MNQKTAVLVIDMLAGNSGLGMPENALKAIQQGARLVKAARDKGLPIIFTNDAHIPGLDKELDLWGNHALVDTPEAQPAPELELCDKDYVIPKRRYSAFFETGLALLLKELGIERIIAIGMDTNICVYHTLADAFFWNYDITVATDATATFLVGTQEDGLERMRVCYGAELFTTDEIIATISG